MKNIQDRRFYQKYKITRAEAIRTAGEVFVSFDVAAYLSGTQVQTIKAGQKYLRFPWYTTIVNDKPVEVIRLNDLAIQQRWILNQLCENVADIINNPEQEGVFFISSQASRIDMTNGYCGDIENSNRLIMYENIIDQQEAEIRQLKGG